jgi:hypothetical protein
MPRCPLDLGQTRKAGAAILITLMSSGAGESAYGISRLQHLSNSIQTLQEGGAQVGSAGGAARGRSAAIKGGETERGSVVHVFKMMNIGSNKDDMKCAGNAIENGPPLFKLRLQSSPKISWRRI